MNQINLVFFGTSEFGLPALNSLIGNNYSIVGVITTPDERSGRERVLTASPIKKTAQNNNLFIIQPEKLTENKELNYLMTSRLKPDLGVVASYGKIIPRQVIDLFRFGILNIHPSILPKYRGPSPIQTQILNGEIKSGITIIKIDEQVDHGPIIGSQEHTINNQNYEQLHKELAKLGGSLLIKILPDYLSGKIMPVEQNHSFATFTKKISKDDGLINWDEPVMQIYNKHRAYYVWPKIYTIWKSKLLYLTKLEISKFNGKHVSNGTVFVNNFDVLISCSDGFFKPDRIQLEGGKEMEVTSFLSGHKDFIGSKLG